MLITDSFGRAWRHGQCDVAIGCAGLAPLEDWRGRADARGRELRATWIAIADELAAAADLARAKDAMQPAVLISGAGRHVIRGDGPGARGAAARRLRGPVSLKTRCWRLRLGRRADGVKAAVDMDDLAADPVGVVRQQPADRPRHGRRILDVPAEWRLRLP